ncbi:MAG: hypothetical protein GY808_12950 [Gammaproteobacteria bacterium]|nr:hypothetical protein [Gammaproteobacteria bacterium]
MMDRTDGQDLVFINCAAFNARPPVGKVCAKCGDWWRNYSIPDGIQCRGRIVVGGDNRREADRRTITYTSNGDDNGIISWYQCRNPAHCHDESVHIKKFAKSHYEPQEIISSRLYLADRGYNVHRRKL